MDVKKEKKLFCLKYRNEVSDHTIHRGGGENKQEVSDVWREQRHKIVSKTM